MRSGEIYTEFMTGGRCRAFVYCRPAVYHPIAVFSVREARSDQGEQRGHLRGQIIWRGGVMKKKTLGRSVDSEWVQACSALL